VKLREGANLIEVRAVSGGEMLIDRVSWSYRKAPQMLAEPQ
jgi:hypothetical protein